MTVNDAHQPEGQQDEYTIGDVEVRLNREVLRRLATARVLSPAEMSMALYLVAGMEPRTGRLRATRDDLARDLGLSPTFVSKVTTKLKNLGLAWRVDEHQVQVNPDFAFRGESRTEWAQALHDLPEDTPAVIVPAYRVTPPKGPASSEERHLRAI